MGYRLPCKANGVATRILEGTAVTDLRTTAPFERDSRPFVSVTARANSKTNGGAHPGGHVEGEDDPVLAVLMADNQDLRARLATLPVIEQAKGILIARYQIDAETAFDLLRRWSSHANLKLRDVAHILVTAASRSPARAGAGRDRLPADLARLIDSLELNGGTGQNDRSQLRGG
jgi:hypothetical protein